jgi:protein involved in polysaccharide export with SLBB domain
MIGIALLLCSSLATGCAAWTNPVAMGIAVGDIPPELLAERKDDLEMMPLSYLRQEPPKEYLLGPGDVLGVFVEGVLGQADQNPPVTLPDATNFTNLPPAIGFPIPIREDGTLPLPLVEPVKVGGLTVAAAEKAIVAAYTVRKQILPPGRERIIVTLMRPRTTRVLVVRQDTPGTSPNTTLGVGYTRGLLGTNQTTGNLRRGAGMTIDLPAYENDVLTALTMTGGLPGNDAKNEIIIQRHSAATPPASPDVNGIEPPGQQNTGTVRIPLRIPRGTKPPITPQDILLHEGDVLLIEARVADVFYTGGFLPPGEQILPRDYDLDVVKAISAIGGPLVNGGLNANNLNGNLSSQGLGNFSPKLVSVLRKTPCGGQVTIIVDLDRALQDPSKSLIIKPGDVVILQETKGQAFGRYISTIFKLGITTDFIKTSASTGTAAVAGP